MDNELELIKTYIFDKNKIPLLINDKYYDELSSSAVTLDADCSLDLLNGYYDDKGNYLPPSWYNELTRKVLIIRNIDSIPVKEQSKFGEILKYKKVNDFSLGEAIIIVTCKDNEISRDILSLVAKV